MKQNNKLKILNILPYIALLVCVLCVIVLKQNYMVDEIYSYGLANHTDGIRIVFEDGKTYVPASKPYLDYMGVNENAKFDYGNVWLNQTNDVHPPLYYAILHTICSFFPGQFSRFFAGGINLVFVLMTLWAFRACLRCFTDNEWSIFAVSMAYALSPGILNNVSFFRMYVMAMCIVTMLYLVYLKKYKSYEQNGSKEKPGFYIALGLLAFCGALTHYYCVIFTVAISFIFALWQLIKRRYANVIGIIITGIVSGGAAYAVFPAMIDHVFHGYRGEQSMDNLKLSLAETLQRFKGFFDKVDGQLFGNTGLIVLGIGVIFLFAAYLYQRKNRQKKENPTFPVILLWLSVLIYFIFVGKSAVYVSDRYMFPVYALIWLSIILPLLIAEDRFSKSYVLIPEVLIVCVLTAMAYFKNTWPYMYMESAPILKAADIHNQADCLFIYDDDWKVQSSFEEVSRYRSVTFVKEDNLSLLDGLKTDSPDGLAVLISSKNENLIDEVRKKFPQFAKMDDIGFYGYAESYYLGKK